MVLAQVLDTPPQSQALHGILSEPSPPSRRPSSLEQRWLQPLPAAQVLAYSPLGLGMLTGKFSESYLPSGPRKLIAEKCAADIASRSFA